jgi:NAD(P)-dependent dehydrogenase (short-subunit alcohol dehydrogenase family)
MPAIGLETKTALVTGAGGAIGSATAHALAQSGAAVACVDVRETVLETAERIQSEGGRALGLILDVGRPGAAEEAVAATLAAWSRLDVLANIAGIGGTGANLLEQPQELWDRMLLVHLTGTMWMCKAALPAMIRQRRGAIINTSSVTGLAGSAGSTAYAAAKAGVIGFTKALAKEVAQFRINVNAVAPGLIDTPMSRARGTTREPERWTMWPRVGMPEDCAALFVFLASDASEFMTGQVISPNGGGLM